MKKLYFLFVFLTSCGPGIWITESQGYVVKVIGNVVCVEYKVIDAKEKAYNCFCHSEHEFQVGDKYETK